MKRIRFTVLPIGTVNGEADHLGHGGLRSSCAVSSTRRMIAILLLGVFLTAAVACSRPSPSQEVSFPTADGGTVVADLYAASGSDAVVLAHGAVFDKASWAPFATWLAGRGHQVLAIDFRGYGRLTAGTDSHALLDDMLAAGRYLHGQRVSVLCST
jgi:dipeptidyl aminopeptidase/acylaminoacyl peptidase